MRKVTLGLGVVMLASIGATLLAQTGGAPPKLDGARFRSTSVSSSTPTRISSTTA